MDFNGKYTNQVSDKKLAKEYEIKELPTLSLFRDGEMAPFEGDLNDPKAVLEFLTSEDSLTLPDKIEEVNADSLHRIITEERFVTALFFDESRYAHVF